MQKLLSPLLLLLLTVAFFVTFFHSITAINQDLGRHILVGEIITTTHTVPKTNLFSYTYPNFPFINHHWGSEVVFYLLYEMFGFPGTFFVTVLSIAIGFFGLCFFAKKHASMLSIGIVGFLSLQILFERTDVRPEMFSMLFFSLFLMILFRNREKPTKWMYTLIPLQLLWTNMHVYFPIGYLTVGLFLLDKILTHYVIARNEMTFTLRKTEGKQSQQLNNITMKQLSPLFITLIGCFLVTFFNPNSISGALYPFHVFDNYGYTIQENQTIFFLWSYSYNQSILFFWITLMLLFIILFFRSKQTRPIDWLLTITFAILAMQAIRNFPLFVFAIFLPFTYHLSALLTSFLKKPKIALFLFFVTSMLFLYHINFVQSKRPVSIETPSGAKNAVDFLQQNNIKGPIFNNFDIGSYLIFRLYPKEKVFVDGRPEAYPASFFQKTYIPMEEDLALFTKISDQYHFQTIFFSHTDQTPWAATFLHEIVKNPQWKIVYLDDTAIILVRKNLYPKLPPLSLTTFSPSSDTLQGLYQYLMFFQTIGDPQNMLKTSQIIVQKDPTNCIGLSLLAQTNNPLYTTRFQTVCQ